MKLYESPSALLFSLKQERCFCATDVNGSGSFGGWNNGGKDAWEGDPDGSGSSMGGWIDSGDSAWG